jgi:serine/threonine protein kinase
MRSLHSASIGLISRNIATLFFLSRILFRDLKPQNVARNPHTATNPFQLFDFGLAKELKAVDRLPMDDGNSYHLTGLTGTLRIMAPEVIQCQPYGLSADVYSFGVLLYEVVSGTSHNLTAVETCKGERPPIPKNSTTTTPAPLATLLQSCWAQDPQRRPTFEQIGQTLQLALETTTTTSTAGEKSPTSKMAASSPPSPTNTNTALLSLQQQQ